LFSYNETGEQEVTALDLNNNGVIDYAGPDRITKTTRTVATKTDGPATYTVERTITQRWETDAQDAPTTASVSEQSTDGLRTWQTVRSLVATSVTSYDGAGGRTVVSTGPDGVRTTQVYAADRLASTTTKTAGNAQLAAATYAYDTYGRLQSASDARNGATTYTYFADDQIATVTTPDPDPARTGPGYDPQTTAYAYDSAGRVQTVTQPDGGVVNTTYWPTGSVKRTWGTRTYPVEYTYDPQGRVKTLTTWQDFAGDTGRAVTTWNYDPARGFLLNKRYTDGTGPSYTYKPSGRLLTRAWARSPALTTTYAYGTGGDLTGITYSDATPAVTTTYDRSGRPLVLVDGSGTRSFAYHPSGQLQTETYTSGPLNGIATTRTYDSLERLGGFSVPSVTSVTYAYDDASRLQLVTSGAFSAAYGYLADSPLVATVTHAQSGATRLVTARSYDKLNRLASITNTLAAPAGPGPGPGHAYAYNAANQRTRATREDNAYWSYAYDALGQVTSAGKFLADATPALGLAHAYAYDDIGNRKTATTNGQTTAFTSSLLNTYTARAVPGAIDVTGIASATATVTVSADGGIPQPTVRQSETFYKQLAVDNTAAAKLATLKITGVKNLVGPAGEDAVTEITKTAYLARTSEPFIHDADGNLTADGRWLYSWDAENRLVALETLPAAVVAGLPRQKLEFVYDGQGRRVAKKVSNWSGTAYTVAIETRFIYDGWNLLAELAVNLTTSTLTPLKTYTWGLDLSGSAQGAGGVGGLLAVNSGTSTYAAAYDGNGNVSALVNAADGTLAARYDYNAFGERVLTDGPAALLNPFRFSTKYEDPETGLLYYGFRYYNPSTGRWLSRDPLEEQGHELIYELSQNTGPVADESIAADSVLPEISLREDILAYRTKDTNEYLAMRNNAVNYIDPDGRHPILRALIILIGKAEAKRRFKRAVECDAIHKLYSETQNKARACKTGMSPQDAAKNCALWSAVVAGRSLYLSKKCDDYLPGSIKKGSKKAEAGHKEQLATTSAAMLACCACALPEKK
jgi:RHS repeat-associated protein